MPHVLNNHINNTWDPPAPYDGGSPTLRSADESPEYSPATRRALAGLALGAGTAIAGFILWGLLAGLLLGIS